MIAWMIDQWRMGWCAHDWELLEKAEVFERPTSGRPCRTVFLYSCKKCRRAKRMTCK